MCDGESNTTNNDDTIMTNEEVMNVEFLSADEQNAVDAASTAAAAAWGIVSLVGTGAVIPWKEAGMASRLSSDNMPNAEEVRMPSEDINEEEKDNGSNTNSTTMRILTNPTRCNMPHPFVHALKTAPYPWGVPSNGLA